MLALPIEMNGESKILRRRKLRQTALQLKRIRAKVNVLLARDEAVNNFDNLRMQQRLAPGQRHHGRTALFHRGKTLLRRKLLLQNMRRILHLAATRARQVAAEERLQ